MAVVQVNPNFHTLTKGSILEREDPVFREYRRKWEEWPKNFKIGEFPLHLDIEATSICNLRCPFCAASYKGADFQKGCMEFEIFQKIDGGDKKEAYRGKVLRGRDLQWPRLQDDGGT